MAWSEEDLKRIGATIVVATVAVFAVAAALVVFLWSAGGGFDQIIMEQFAAVIGLPMAAAASLFIIFVVRLTAGPIEVEIGPLKFKGAAGPLVFWVICYLAIATTIKMTWQPELLGIFRTGHSLKWGGHLGFQSGGG